MIPFSWRSMIPSPNFLWLTVNPVKSKDGTLLLTVERLLGAIPRAQTPNLRTPQNNLKSPEAGRFLRAVRFWEARLEMLKFPEKVRRFGYAFKLRELAALWESQTVCNCQQCSRGYARFR
jgi:hypothetical protein